MKMVVDQQEDHTNNVFLKFQQQGNQQGSKVITLKKLIYSDLINIIKNTKIIDINDTKNQKNYSEYVYILRAKKKELNK